MTPPAAIAGFDRRAFLKLGVAGTWTLVACSTAATLAGCSTAAPPASGYRWLSTEDLALFSALLPAVNGPAWPDETSIRDEALRRIDAALAALAPQAQEQTRQLLDLLHWPVFRHLACGLSAPWSRAPAEDIARFLQRWRDSRLELFNAGYRGLAKLAQLGWWSQRASWDACRYPGPPAWAVAALNG
ncbi:hypothetical protein SAMN04488120_1109 [Fontimonas thermophila]|uniref:Twin-arginine translocation pathway signal protein n=1 Tax=Fontimonas thermophila TaxID=1076937 RepID=A0A1I2JUS7_9GAMM|nr:hypothetical protein [Fontimonas thermophila]SFF57813.1 hypothetical protein SAMN04488120_1109 [Fontimonas thermophila]